MADPPRFGQPDTTRSALYDFAQDYDDNGAVHTNSGVPNKTAYLIADGTAGRAGRRLRRPRVPGHRHDARGLALLGRPCRCSPPARTSSTSPRRCSSPASTSAFSPAECATVRPPSTSTGLARWAGPSVPRQVMAPGARAGAALVGARRRPAGRPLSARTSWRSRPRSRRRLRHRRADGHHGWVLTGLAPGVDYTLRLIAVTADGTSPAVVRGLAGTALRVCRPPATRSGAAGSTSRGPAAQHGRRRAGRPAGPAAPPRRRLLGVQRGGSAVVHHRPTAAFALRAGRPGAERRWYVVYAGAAAELGVRGQQRGRVVRQRVTLGPADRQRSLPARRRSQRCPERCGRPGAGWSRCSASARVALGCRRRGLPGRASGGRAALSRRVRRPLPGDPAACGWAPPSSGWRPAPSRVVVLNAG